MLGKRKTSYLVGALAMISRAELQAPLSSKGQLVVPRAVRARLGLKPGDKVRFIERDGAFLIERVSAPAGDDPFAGFAEWASVTDHEAFRDL